MLGTVAGTVAMCIAQGCLLRRELGGVEGARTLAAALLMAAAAALLAGAAYGVWYGLDAALGRCAARPGGLRARRDRRRHRRLRRRGLVLRVPEARQIHALLLSRRG